MWHNIQESKHQDGWNEAEAAAFSLLHKLLAQYLLDWQPVCGKQLHSGLRECSILWVSLRWTYFDLLILPFLRFWRTELLLIRFFLLRFQISPQPMRREHWERNYSSLKNWPINIEMKLNKIPTVGNEPNFSASTQRSSSGLRNSNQASLTRPHRTKSYFKTLTHTRSATRLKI